MVLMAVPAAPATPPAEQPEFLESCDPATGEVIARFRSTPAAALPEIFARAHQAQQVWAAVSLRERCHLLARLRDVIFSRRAELAEVVTRESGKPLVEALLADVFLALDAADYYARRAPRLLRPERVPHHSLGAKGKLSWVHYEPFGVLGVISPWNYPFSIPMSQIIPAVAAGNAVVLKPSEMTPWCGALVGEVFANAGFPADLVQVAQGSGALGAAMIELSGAERVGAGADKFLFTGSVATGRRVAQACAQRLIPCVLELGGKDAMLVLSDAPLENAARAAVWGAYMNCGQTCISVERVYVEEAVADRFIARCVALTQQLRLGHGLDPETDVGPLIRQRQLERVEAQLQDAVARGARILTGGVRRPELGPCFLEPAVVDRVDHSMRLLQEETFGPVLPICRVRDVEQAVTLANDSVFALAASVWTRDRRRGRQVAAQLRAGAVMINDVASYYGICEAPHGGRGASGWGRTHGRLGLLELVHPKYVDVDYLSRWPKPWWYGYNQALLGAADRFVEFLLAPTRRQRWRAAGGARALLPFRRQGRSMIRRTDRSVPNAFGGENS